MPGGINPSTSDQTARVSQLEGLVTTYKAELEAISRDSREVEQALTQGAGLVKLSALVEAESRATQMERSKCPNFQIVCVHNWQIAHSCIRPRIS